MMSVGQFWAPLAEHLYISAIPLIVAIAIAWPVSSWLVRGINALNSRGRESLLVRSLAPWRAAVVTLVVMFLPFVPAILLFESQFLGFASGMALASFVVAVVLLTNARSLPGPLRGITFRLPSAVRTISVVVIGLAAIGYEYYYAGAGRMINAGRQEFMSNTMWNGIIVLAAAALLVDLLFGILIYSRAARSHEANEAP